MKRLPEFTPLQLNLSFYFIKYFIVLQCFCLSCIQFQVISYYKCCKLVLVYHFRDILHYLLTHSLYRMWHFVYHLCEVVCLMHNHSLCMYQKWYITYHKVLCNRTKLPILKKQYSINCKTCTTCNTSF